MIVNSEKRQYILSMTQIRFFFESLQKKYPQPSLYFKSKPEI